MMRRVTVTASRANLPLLLRSWRKCAELWVTRLLMTASCCCSAPWGRFSAAAWSRRTWWAAWPLTAGKRAAALLTQSGNEESNFCLPLTHPDLFHLVVTSSLWFFRDFVSAFIHFKKPIVVAINGPALGLGASILPLCDVVWASEKACFQTPCAALHLTPSGCSSYTFPQILGVALVSTNVPVLSLTLNWNGSTPSPFCYVPPAGQWDAVLWKKTHGAGGVQSRPGVASLLANHI